MILETLNNLSFRVRCLLIFITGAAMALAMPPTGWWPLLFICLSLFYVLLSPHHGRRAFVLGWLFGFGYFLVGLYWIGNALLVPGNDFVWAWPLAVLGLPFALAFFTGLGVWMAARIADFRTWRGFIALILCLMTSEYLRGHIFTGFPWNLYGYGWDHVLPMVQAVSLFGVYGLTLLTIIWASLPGFLLTLRADRKTTTLSLGLMILSIAVFFGWGWQRLNTNPTVNVDDVIVRVVQPNIAQEDKWNNDKLVENLQKTVRLSAAPRMNDKTYAIIWPETAISDYVIRDINAAEFISTNLLSSPPETYLISGVLRHEINADENPLYYNSLVAYDSDLVPAAVYDKSHLVPFGEYIPYQKYIPLRPVVQFAGFTPGNGVKTEQVAGLPPFSAVICYEVLFPGKVALRTPRPAWIINATNDGWYGDSPGPYQHLSQTVFRAVEEGMPLVRSANTGVSAMVDSYGRRIGGITYNKDGFFDAALPRATDMPTYYSKFKDAFLFFTSLLLAILLVLLPRKARIY